MAAQSRLQSLTYKTSLQNLIHRHLLRPAAATTTTTIATAAVAEPAVHFDLRNPKSVSTTYFSNANEFLLNRKFPIGVISALPTFDLSIMELRGSRSTSSKKNSPDLEEDLEDDDYEDDDDEGGMKRFELDDEYGSFSDSDSDDDDNYGRLGDGGGGGSRSGGAYRV